MTDSFLANVAEIDWLQYPGHFGGALSKPLITPQTCRSRRIDHRISCYAPMAFVEPHVHEVQEQVYHVLEGEGLLTLDGQRHLLRRHDYVFVPPGVRHGFTNNGTVPLVFLVITTPVTDEEPL
ncbi:cupin domain-containing protein [Variovorax sp. J22P240]|uniref:cupin domain-containing protein n=1 Tax=Variovorax sp. J22P240 TaxID=3053514 RepID=UPI002575B649|nr:cupin domain-containing protein [Variovorax sp. J22P240]MDM0002825.1 cupin domain-containing protein [Variovorax sp. J22P240]